MTLILTNMSDLTWNQPVASPRLKAVPINEVSSVVCRTSNQPNSFTTCPLRCLMPIWGAIIEENQCAYVEIMCVCLIWATFNQNCNLALTQNCGVPNIKDREGGWGQISTQHGNSSQMWVISGPTHSSLSVQNWWMLLLCPLHTPCRANTPSTVYRRFGSGREVHWFNFTDNWGKKTENGLTCTRQNYNY